MKPEKTSNHVLMVAGPQISGIYLASIKYANPVRLCVTVVGIHSQWIRRASHHPGASDNGADNQEASMADARPSNDAVDEIKVENDMAARSACRI